MAGYVCKNCGFRTETSRADKTCPYCDRKSLEKEQSADELLEEAG